MTNIYTDEAAASSQKSRIEDAVYDYLERGYSVVPISLTTKKPMVKWQKYQGEQPCEPDVRGWLATYGLFNIAIITGNHTGMVVLDCDNEEAEAYARDTFPPTGVEVRTQRGTHMYYTHPQDRDYRNRAGGVIKNALHWPKVNGLDFRGDGGYVLAPPSIKIDEAGNVLHEYEWDISGAPTMWPDWQPPRPVNDDNIISMLDLGSVSLESASISIEQETADLVAKIGKLPPGGGNGRNERVMRYASEQIVRGVWGDDLRAKCEAFQQKYFAAPLDAQEFAATLGSVEAMERRNHPERFDSQGNYIPITTNVIQLTQTKPAPSSGLRVLTPADMANISEDNTRYLINPLLKPGGVMQVFGYTGHGKSLFLQYLLHHLALGESCGPFEIERAARILYLDYENGQSTLMDRFGHINKSFGTTRNLLLVPQFTYNKAGEKVEVYETRLNTADGLRNVQTLIDQEKPDILVIDTIRSGFGNFEENSAPAWKPVNEFINVCKRMGLATIVAHHGNKPSADKDGKRNAGGEAGSTAQLNLVETQLGVTLMLPNENEAKRRRAMLLTPEIETGLRQRMEDEISPSLEPRLLTVFELGYGKIRDWTENHTSPMYFGIAEDKNSVQYIISSSSPKQKAIQMHQRGYSARDISQTILKPMSAVIDWTDTH